MILTCGAIQTEPWTCQISLRTSKLEPSIPISKKQSVIPIRVPNSGLYEPCSKCPFWCMHHVNLFFKGSQQKNPFRVPTKRTMDMPNQLLNLKVRTHKKQAFEVQSTIWLKYLYLYIYIYIYVLFYRASSAGCQQMLAISYIYSKVSILLEGIYSDPTSMAEVHHPLVTYQASNPQFDQNILCTKYPAIYISFFYIQIKRRVCMCLPNTRVRPRTVKSCLE